MTANELEVLEHYNRKILKYGENPEVLLKCLGKLDQVRVNIELLSVRSQSEPVQILNLDYLAIKSIKQS